MSADRRGGPAPRPRVLRTSEIGEALKTISPQRAQMLLAVAIYGATPAEVAQRMGIPISDAIPMVMRAVSQMHHPARSARLRDYVIGGDDEEIVIDSDLRALIRQWRVEETLVPRCATCDVLLPPASSREGRPREYCSNACRQKAYRRRKTATRSRSEGQS